MSSVLAIPRFSPRYAILNPGKIGGIMKYKWIRKIRYNTPHSVTDAFYKFEDKIPKIEGLNVVSEKHNLAQLNTHGDEMFNKIDYLEPDLSNPLILHYSSNLTWIIFQLHAGVAQTRNFYHNKL